jgi:glycosyltransferase involved in cell wall biosynthesis
MKICFFTENYHKGGLDTFLINLIDSWPESGDALTLVCNGTHPGIETIMSKTSRPLAMVRYHRFFSFGVSRGQGSDFPDGRFLARVLRGLGYRILQYPVLLPWYIVSLVVFFRRHDFDRVMVVNGGYPASLLCRCAAIAWRFSGKKPLATFTFHNSATRPPWYYFLPEYLIDRLVIDSSRHIVSVSSNCLDSLKIRNAFRAGAKLRFIYNGIADPASRANGTGGAQGRDPDVPYCLMLATYEPRKGHVFLLRAFRLVANDFPGVRLCIYGFGSPEQKQVVTDEVKSLSLEHHVSLNDFTTETGPLISNARVLVVPSQAFESFGLTIIEAMAFGTPVVTTDVGGMPEVLAGSHAGYVCPKDDPVAFADAIKRILGNPSLAADLGRNGRQTFEQRFTSSIMAKQYQVMISEKD